MGKPATTSRRAPDPKDKRREGYKLAITMLRELELSPSLCDDCALDELRTGKSKPQNNIVFRYLVKCRGRSLPLDVAAGFCAVLSDMVSDCSEGFVPNSVTYQKGLKIRMPTRIEIRPADKKLRTWKAIQRVTGKDYGPMPPDFGTPGRAKKQRDARK